MLTQKMSLCLFIYYQHQEVTWSYILPQTGKCRFKHQIVSESNKNCNVLQNNQKRGTHEVSGLFNIIWPNFTPPAAEQELPAAMKPDTLTHKTEHTAGLKMPLTGFTSSFKPFRHRLAQKGNSCSKVNSPGSDSVEDIKSSIKAYGWT